VAIAIVATAPLIVRAALFLQGTTWMLFAPLDAALNSNNLTRSHLILLPLEIVGLGTTAALLILFVRSQRRNPELVLPLVLLGMIAAGLYSTGHYTSGHRPGRYAIYMTPWLAIVIAGAIDGLAERLAVPLGSRRRARRLTAAVTCVGLLLPNVVAIRLEQWRHKLTDSFQVLDYVRVAALVRADLARTEPPVAASICVQGLEPLPHDAPWRRHTGYPRPFHDYSARAVLAQGLGRRDVSTIQVDCESADARPWTYVVRGADVVRAGESVDSFAQLNGRLRDRIRAGDYRGAARLIEDNPNARPFIVRYLLEHLSDDDLVWLTNGRSVMTWLSRIAANYDHWFVEPTPKVSDLLALARADLEAYVRYRFMVWYVDVRNTLARDRVYVASRTFTFGGLSMEEIAAIVRADPWIAADPQMQHVLSTIVHMPSHHVELASLGATLTITSPEFWGVLVRLVLGPLIAPRNAG
jgi:hypothetical protein